MAKKLINAEIIDTLQKQLVEHNTGGYIVTDRIDQLYITGFPFYDREAVFLVTRKEVYCFTRDLYVLEFSNYAPFIRTSAPLNFAAAAAETALKLKLKNVIFDSAKTMYLEGKIFDAAGFKPAKLTLGKMREIKTGTELEIMRTSCRIAYRTYEYIKTFIKSGMSEKQVAAEIDSHMKSLGATANSFSSTVCFGSNSNNTHHVPSDDRLKKESAVLLDFGCIFKNYCSDITRSWWHGAKPPEEYKKVWNTVDRARAAGIAAAKPGISGKDLDLVSRNIISNEGYGQYFIHRTGHGIGMEAHETPCVQASNLQPFVENNVITVEPGVYIPGRFGVRLEDTVAVGKDGGIILTKK